MCGEESFTARLLTGAWEIPPRVRGRARLPVSPIHRAGNTPACAGKRWSHPACFALSRKYPRVCGEEHDGIYRHDSLPEIPPRVRGRAQTPTIRSFDDGNTPACAGKSRHYYDCRCVLGKYPRVCGEEPATLRSTATLGEIPPRVRGRAHPFYNI